MKYTREQMAALMRGEEPEPENVEPGPDPFDQRLRQLEEKYTEPEQRAELSRLRVAKRVGLNPRLAARLVGDTEEDLEADAREMLAAFPGQQVKRRPAEQLRGGLGVDAQAKLDPRALAALVHRSPFDR